MARKKRQRMLSREEPLKRKAVRQAPAPAPPRAERAPAEKEEPRHHRLDETLKALGLD